MSTVMRCKLQLHDITTVRYAGQDTSKRAGATVRFGAVWEGSTEKQAASENAIFGEATPMAEFKATIQNGVVVDALVPGKKYYVTFTEAPD
ncbi:MULTISPECIES: hypothetical protein [Burkholderia]|uniref:Uncharacterized protein n=1 Tax=Burkholderia glumae TaxID=337 RepID=A0AAP9Y3K4_BURGL|nr:MULTISPECIES: hypothetical protein [Burkholderia]AJY66459.1 hypothetical protein KS03_2915 [Burkholderia glumae LMG 2196 = ATCC 33617]QPQ93214.1 hypothetical protein I6H06_13105 [Burkholderia glumae]QQM91583.1 hypothetical protein I6G78_04645 [Burkholderia glumae]